MQMKENMFQIILLKEIDLLFDKTYSLMANGAFNSSDKSKARFLAELNSNKDQYTRLVEKLEYNEKNILEQYYNSKVKELELVFSNITNLKIKDIESYGSKYNCVYANSLSNNPLIKYVAVHEIKNNKIISTNYHNYDDTYLTNDKDLIVLPSLNVRYANYSSTRPTFNTVYKGMVVSKLNKGLINGAIVEIDKIYDNIVTAISKGNYNKGNLTEENVFTSIYGDTNLINNGIISKYSNNTEVLNIVTQYLNYKQSLMVSKVYNNNYNINYFNYENYNKNNYSVRVSEENGIVYYRVYPSKNSTLYTTKALKDNGFIKTANLSNNQIPVVNNNMTIQVVTDVNMVVDGTLYTPTDVNGRIVKPFIYNGTTYAPVRATASILNKNINWNSSKNAVELTSKTSDTYYTDANGQRVYVYETSPITNNGVTYSKSSLTTINVIKGAKIYNDGSLVIPRNVNGVEVDIFSVNGTIYVPVRMMVQLSGADISYDATTNSIYINRNNIIVNQPVDIEKPIPDSGTIINESKAYYIDPVTGQKVYIEENQYIHTR